MEDRDHELLQRFDRDFSTDRRGRMRVRNPVRPYALLGLLVGVVASTAIALTDRGGFLTTGLLQVMLAACAALSLLLGLVSLVARGRGRVTAGRLLGHAIKSPRIVAVLEDLLSVGEGLDITEREVGEEQSGKRLGSFATDAPIIAMIAGDSHA